MENQKPGYELAYYSLAETDQFQFYQVPQLFFTDERFLNPPGGRFSAEAKLLYAVLLNRVSLSRKNHWTDQNGHVYIVFTNDEVQKAMGCANGKATKMMCELENLGLIERDKTIRADKIYVKNFASLFPLAQKAEVDEPVDEFPASPEENLAIEIDLASRKSGSADHDNQDLQITKTGICKSRKPGYRHTDLRQNDFRQTESILPSANREWTDRINQRERELKTQIDYDALAYDYGSEVLDGLVEIMLELDLSQSEYTMIGREKVLTSLVKRQFEQLHQFSVEYVLTSLATTSGEIKDMYAYLLKSLYRAGKTYQAHINTRVNHHLSATIRAG